MPEFRKNVDLERILTELNGDLGPAERALQKRYYNDNQKYPLILIMGSLRSGTTLFMQWLASSGLFSYPTNLLSRFYYAPVIGSKIQLMLTDTDYRFRDELGEFNQNISFSSDNGKTTGVLSPNEFWYFWRQYLSEPDRDVWTDTELQQGLDSAALRSALIGVMDVMKKPFAAKGMLFNYNIPVLDKIFDKVVFVHLKRDSKSSILSVIEARKRQLGDESLWYSFKIPEYEKLKTLDPIGQVAGQICYINRAIDRGLSNIDNNRKMLVEYESFCKNPEKFYHELREILKRNEYLIPEKYSGPNSFVPTRA
jgi:hypothetical protein